MNDYAPWIRICCLLLLLGTIVAVGAVWATPMEVIQARAVERAGDDPYARFEAMGRSEALTWFLRTTLPVGLVLFWPSRRRADRVALFVKGFCQNTRRESSDSGTTEEVSCASRIWMLQGLCLLRWQFREWMGRNTGRRTGQWRAWAVRGRGLARACLLQLFCLGWAGLAIMHLAGAVDQRTRDWPYYRLSSGASVLPNMSESNRMLIHYLSRSTPEDARILILSDQKLFFVSYYLLPRRIYHPMHPDAEFVIPQPDQQRPLPAYRLSDLDAEYLQRLDPDYVVEYFEGPDYVDAGRLLEDSDWIAFAREWRGDPNYMPSFNVVLHTWDGEDDAP